MLLQRYLKEKKENKQRVQEPPEGVQMFAAVRLESGTNSEKS